MNYYLWIWECGKWIPLWSTPAKTIAEARILHGGSYPMALQKYCPTT